MKVSVIVYKGEDIPQVQLSYIANTIANSAGCCVSDIEIYSLTDEELAKIIAKAVIVQENKSKSNEADETDKAIIVISNMVESINRKGFDCSSSELYKTLFSLLFRCHGRKTKAEKAFMNAIHHLSDEYHPGSKEIYEKYSFNSIVREVIRDVYGTYRTGTI